ncbi:hypothetical protein THIOM_001776 [Candidatus Thiomargarita nelsonii]|uniref:Uncharacterized protein n=1 Tax=Candidatus Thiomargarita nelsonii TaxID=1003181 RepID=A0A176S323_9GAMM|nr:hypothetical protein THIOM_001776 [Candidatus Thiomargarita nelsonii]
MRRFISPFSIRLILVLKHIIKVYFLIFSKRYFYFLRHIFLIKSRSHQLRFCLSDPS